MSIFTRVEHGISSFARRLSAPQLVFVGFLSYALSGWALLCPAMASGNRASILDNLFTSVSAISTTGLTTVSVGEDYTWFGQLVILSLIQLGGIGYMTLSSFVILARKQPLGPSREGVLKAQFALPSEFNIGHFVWQVAVFTLMIEGMGTIVLYLEFLAVGQRQPLWHAVFHSVSSFCTAGFSLNNNSLEDYAANAAINITISLLGYLGAVGFIVLADVWFSLRSRTKRLTFTSTVILAMTTGIFAVATPLLFCFDPLLAELPATERLMAAAFQVMSASSTTGFNTVPISQMGGATIMLITMIMVIGASPSGTGGGVKTTSVSALMAVVWSTLRGRPVVGLMGREIPLERLQAAASQCTMYLGTLGLGVYALALAEHTLSIELLFECVSALGTVGLSMGATAALNTVGKLVVIGLMFLGRVGPLTAGLALLQRRTLLPSEVALPRGELTL